MTRQAIGFAKGDRVRLVGDQNPYTRAAIGDVGTVAFVGYAGSGRFVHVAWDSGPAMTMLIDDGERLEKIED